MSPADAIALADCYHTPTDTSPPNKGHRQSANEAASQNMIRARLQTKRYNARKPPFHAER